MPVVADTNTSKKMLPLLAAFFPVACWVAVICYYSINLPWFDDFETFFVFLHNWTVENSTVEKLYQLYYPNNEHRMILSRILTLAQLRLAGHLDFTQLHLIGAGFTLGTLYLLWRAFKTTGLNTLYFIPVTFLLFQLQYHLIYLWAICSHQHQIVVFCACLSMYTLAYRRLGPALLFAVCATFSMGNGIFIWPAGLVVLLLGKRYRSLAIWCVTAGAAIFLYFYGLSAQGNESSLDFFLRNPHLSVLGFFAFLGGLFDFFPEHGIVARSVLPVMAGMAVSTWIAVWLAPFFVSWFETTSGRSLKIPARLSPGKAPDDYQLFVTGVLAFLLVNAFIIGLLRPRFGFFVMIVSNYKLYPALFLALAYLARLSSAASASRRRTIFQSCLAVAAGTWILSAAGYLPIISERHKYLKANGYNQEYNGYGLGHVPFSPHARYIDSLSREMVRAGLYRFPEGGKILAAEAGALPMKPADGILSVGELPEGLLFTDPERGMSLNKNTGQYAFLRNEQRTYLFKLEPKTF